MSLVIRSGSLFDSSLTSLGQGVNIRGVMGAGIAVEFRRRFPQMYEHYREVCRLGALDPGYVHRFRENGINIYNIASQDEPGRHARVRWLRSGLERSLEIVADNGESGLAIPRIGCGIGGLEWDEVEEVIDEVADDFGVKVEVWVQ